MVCGVIVSLRWTPCTYDAPHARIRKELTRACNARYLSWVEEYRRRVYDPFSCPSITSLNYTSNVPTLLTDPMLYIYFVLIHSKEVSYTKTLPDFTRILFLLLFATECYFCLALPAFCLGRTFVTAAALQPGKFPSLNQPYLGPTPPWSPFKYFFRLYLDYL